MKQYLAIDIGGTAVKLGIVDEEGRVLSKTEQSVCFDNYETPILTTVLSATEQFLKEQAVEPQGLAGIGVSAAGQIDTRKGIVAGTCGSLPNYIGSPIKAELEAKFGLPTTVANDANCMTLGEVWVGGAKGYTDVIGVTLGTGVGGGILTGGRLLEGARGLGGELGHFRTHALDGVLCTCGASGCWERYAATTALVRGAQPRNPKWKDGRAIFESPRQRICFFIVSFPFRSRPATGGNSRLHPPCRRRCGVGRRGSPVLPQKRASRRHALSWRGGLSAAPAVR
jgi:glucokinase